MGDTAMLQREGQHEDDKCHLFTLETFLSMKTYGCKIADMSN